MFIAIIAFVGGVSQLYLSHAATPLVQGRVYDSRTGQGIKGVTLTGCNGHTPNPTDSNGNYYFSVGTGGSYCARVMGGIPAGWSGPDTVNNRTNHTGALTYEYQIAGIDCIHAYPVPTECDANTKSWDRTTDSGVDFAYVSPTPAPTPTPTPTPNPTPTPTPTPTKPPTTTRKTTTTPGASAPTPDTTAPTAPTNFTATADTSSNDISLQWQASTDNVGVNAYQLERSTDQQNWDVLDANLTDISYSDQTADFGTHYYYRIKALDAAGNNSGYATADAVMSNFSPNAHKDKDAHITSDDKVATVLIPAGSLAADSDCSLSVTTDALPPSFSGYKYIAGPYGLDCRNANGDSATSYGKPLVLITQVNKNSLKGVSKVQYFGQKGKTWQNLKITSHNKKTGQDSVQLDSYHTFVIMGKQKKTPFWVVLLEIVAIIAALIFALRWFVRWRILKRAEQQDEDYLHKSRGF